ncbi:hypothetical protein IWW45_008237 [Coemansia sp. RSA 485]|nr:hypothetical protein IWW45_008237 [Coemansia sp. RSA 485]
MSSSKSTILSKIKSLVKGKSAEDSGKLRLEVTPSHCSEATLDQAAETKKAKAQKAAAAASKPNYEARVASALLR